MCRRCGIPARTWCRWCVDGVVYGLELVVGDVSLVLEWQWDRDFPPSLRITPPLLRIHSFIYSLIYSSSILAPQPPVGQGLLIHKVSRSHTTTHHSR